MSLRVHQNNHNLEMIAEEIIQIKIKFASDLIHFTLNFNFGLQLLDEILSWAVGWLFIHLYTASK